MVDMRDPKRIGEMVDVIRDIWDEYPDLRLCQLIGNCFPRGDSYYREDDELLEALKAIYKVTLGN